MLALGDHCQAGKEGVRHRVGLLRLLGQAQELLGREVWQAPNLQQSLLCVLAAGSATTPAAVLYRMLSIGSGRDLHKFRQLQFLNSSLLRRANDKVRDTLLSYFGSHKRAAPKGRQFVRWSKA